MCDFHREIYGEAIQPTIEENWNIVKIAVAINAHFKANSSTITCWATTDTGLRPYEQRWPDFLDHANSAKSCDSKPAAMEGDPKV